MSRGQFVRLGAALGLGVVAVPAAGCGGSGGGEEISRGQAIARDADLEPGSALAFTDARSGRPCVLVRLEDGKFVAYSAECTHQGCTVSYKEGQGGAYLGCPCHNSVFEPADGGRVLSGPAVAPLPEIPVEVRDGRVFRA